MSRQPSPGRLRFTLIELLVVVSIIAILAAMLLPALSKARERTRRIVCVGNLNQIGMMCHLYADDMEGYYPGNNLNPNWITRNSITTAPDTYCRGVGFLRRPAIATWPPLPVTSYASSAMHFFCPNMIGYPSGNFRGTPDWCYDTRQNHGYVYWGDPWNTVTWGDMLYVSRMGSGSITIWTTTGFAYGPEHLERGKYGAHEVALTFDIMQVNPPTVQAAHAYSGNVPAGGNVLFVDGHVSWNDAQFWGTGGGANNWFVPRWAVP